MHDAWHYQIKSAQRDLVTMAGGIERSAALTGYSKSVVGRWSSTADPEHMPLTAVRRLEQETGQPLITTIMAHETGRRLSEPDGPAGDARTLDELMRGLTIDVMEAGGETARATTDNHVSPAEKRVISHPVSRARDKLRQIEQLLGAFEAEGGAAADLRLVRGQ